MQDLIARITPALVDLIAVTVIGLLAYATGWVKLHTSNSKVNQIVDRATHDLSAFVAEQAQIVDSFRNADGILTLESAAQAKAAVISRFKATWGPEGLKELLKILGIQSTMLDQWIASHVELAVRNDKTTNVVVPSLPALPPHSTTESVTASVTTTK